VTFVPAGGTAASAADAFFPGPSGVQTLHSAYNFPLLAWNGKGTGLGLLDIARSAAGITCRLVNDQSWDMPVVLDWSITPSQTSALLEWQCDKTGLGQWNLRWGEQNGVDERLVAIGSQTSYLIGALEPGRRYYCELYYTRANVTGKVYRMEFQALDRLSDYPLIGGLDRSFRAGDRLRLFLLNQEDDLVSVSWQINGDPCTGEQYVFEKAGSYKIVAVLDYADGSKETLTKIVEVQDGN
jgi:hypothetical protein